MKSQSLFVPDGQFQQVFEQKFNKMQRNLREGLNYLMFLRNCPVLCTSYNLVLYSSVSGQHECSTKVVFMSGVELSQGFKTETVPEVQPGPTGTFRPPPSLLHFQVAKARKI